MITGVFCLTARSWKKRRETRRPGQIVFFLSFLQVVGRGADRRGWGCRSSLGCLRVVRPSLCQFLFRSSRCSGGSLGRGWRVSLCLCLCLCLTVCRSSARCCCCSFFFCRSWGGPRCCRSCSVCSSVLCVNLASFAPSWVLSLFARSSGCDGVSLRFQKLTKTEEKREKREKQNRKQRNVKSGQKSYRDFTANLVFSCG